MNIEKLKSLLGNDPELNALTDEAIKRGFLDSNGNPTEKNNRINSNLESYSNFMAEPQFVMFKVEGIDLENVDLGVFDLIRDSVHSIIDMSWHKQKEAGYKVNRQDYHNNVSLSLKHGSFQVDIELPSASKLAAKENMDSLVNNLLNQNIDDFNISNKQTRDLLSPIRMILSNPKVTGIKMSTDKSIDPNDAPEIPKKTMEKIDYALNKYEHSIIEEVVDTSFNENVLVFASDSKKKVFSGYARDLKVFNFDCTEPENGDAWWNVINNQIASVDDLSNTVAVRVVGTLENSKKVNVSSVTLDPQ